MGRLSRIVLELFEEAPATGAKPVWKAQHRANGFSPEPGTTDAIYASAGQGRFHGRYLRISTESTVPFSPQIADVGMYESLVPSTIKASASGRALPNGREVQIPANAKWLTFSLVPPRLPGALRLGARARVVGVDSNWLPIGATDNLDYHGLPPGDYILEAQLRHTDQNWNQATIRMPIVVVEPWWQRPIAHVGAAVGKIPMPAASFWRFHSAFGMRVTSTPASRARARRAPTVASSRAVCWNGSQPKKRVAFSHVILSISSREQLASWSSPQANSGELGQVVSVWG